MDFLTVEQEISSLCKDAKACSESIVGPDHFFGKTWAVKDSSLDRQEICAIAVRFSRGTDIDSMSGSPHKTEEIASTAFGVSHPPGALGSHQSASSSRTTEIVTFFKLGHRNGRAERNESDADVQGKDTVVDRGTEECTNVGELGVGVIPSESFQNGEIFRWKT
ncbi:hypothetical protein K438DRAFT_1771062 [Mycena galopus ATCC 62051]|nr:hypothetical protein K438DRAFT_1771062 [Mycena galopus ATCC 62051]